MQHKSSRPFHPSRALRLSALCIALSLAGLAVAATPAAFDQRRADVVRAPGAGVLADARAGSPQSAVAGVLRARGRDAGSLAALRTAGGHLGRNSMKHVRFEQTADGLPVYGAYAKAAFDRSGALVQVIDHLAKVPAGALAAARIDAPAALRVALARLYPGLQGMFPLLSSSAGTTLFDGGAFFDEAPSVRAVAVPMTDGSLARGWLVETWSLRDNRLHNTLVGGDGQVLKVELRTQSDSYNVFREDPLKGPQTVVAGPGSGNPQSPAGWLTGRSEKEFRINGNNVDAYLDSDANNRPDPGGVRASGGNFLTAADLGQAPTIDSNKTVAVQNLFYLNNVVHDILYSHGFDEAAGNFQTSNFGIGGADKDAVRAEAQDGGGTDNANFSTPPDGRKPRMQMYLWSGAGPTHELALSSPVAVTYSAMGATFGPVLNTSGLSGSLSAASPADGCTGPLSGVAGRIAIIDRGSCNFTVKAANAQAAGATGVVVANNQGGSAIFTMGGTDTTITIPAVMIGQTDGAALKALASPAGAIRAKSVQPLMIDASLDSDVVFHEYGHGLTWRMIGNMSGPVSGAIGEGASDGVSLLINGGDVVGEYSASSPLGTRRFPYAGYPLTYADVNGAEVHNDGEIYAAVIWKLIDLFGPARRSELFDYYVDGMNFTPAAPFYEDMRDGILASVAAGPTPGDRCTVWSAFAQFGIGVGSSAVINPDQSVTTSPSFAVPGDCAP
jgi:hypothetical protein